MSEYLFPPAHIILSADVVVEFDRTNYTAIEGEDVIFRVVKQTDSSREMTVVFNTRPDSASGESKRELLNIPVDFTMILLSNLYSNNPDQWVLETLR